MGAEGLRVVISVRIDSERFLKNAIVALILFGPLSVVANCEFR